MGSKIVKGLHEGEIEEIRQLVAFGSRVEK